MERLENYRCKAHPYLDFNYKKALGLAEWERIKEIVEKEACARAHRLNESAY